jgi:hypothetical protein
MPGYREIVNVRRQNAKKIVERVTIEPLTHIAYENDPIYSVLSYMRTEQTKIHITY